MNEAIAQSPRDIQRRAMLLVDKEVHFCVSTLVSTLSNNALLVERTRGGNELSQLIDKAAELAAPVLDYESAAIEAGWSRVPHNGMFSAPLGHTFRLTDYEDWSECCAENDIEPHESEVYEHWAVSEWLGERLAVRGERVDMDFSGLHVWARTATGQAIAMDEVMQRITSETGYASGV